MQSWVSKKVLTASLCDAPHKNRLSKVHGYSVTKPITFSNSIHTKVLRSYNGLDLYCTHDINKVANLLIFNAQVFVTNKHFLRLQVFNQISLSSFSQVKHRLVFLIIKRKYIHSRGVKGFFHELGNGSYTPDDHMLYSTLK